MHLHIYQCWGLRVRQNPAEKGAGPSLSDNVSNFVYFEFHVTELCIGTDLTGLFYVTQIWRIRNWRIGKHSCSTLDKTHEQMLQMDFAKG